MLFGCRCALAQLALFKEKPLDSFLLLRGLQFSCSHLFYRQTAFGVPARSLGRSDARLMRGFDELYVDFIANMSQVIAGYTDSRGTELLAAVGGSQK